jgi:hypothetical protein
MFSLTARGLFPDCECKGTAFFYICKLLDHIFSIYFLRIWNQACN